MRRTKVLGGLVAAALATAATGARAEWLEASSRHFRIYSDTSAGAVRTLATRLEQVDGALRVLSGIPDTVESASNPVTVYVLDDAADVQRLSGGQDVAGFYLGRASGAVAFTPRTGSDTVDPQIVLFHEYAHHFLLARTNVAYPAWLSEGYAEFVATARFPKAGVMIGAPAQHRAYGLLDAGKLPIAKLFAPGAKPTPLETDQLYGRGWLLTHYLMFGSPARRGQLPAYLQALDAGTPPLEAAAKGFGDLKLLDRELEAYLRRSSINAATIPAARLPAVKVEVRPLTPGERALVEMRMISTRGVNGRTAAPLFARAARAAAPFPNDAVAQGWLAEMAFDAGDDAAAAAAADRALAADPASRQALLYKARVALRGLAKEKAAPADPRWARARASIVKANRANPDAAEPLALFYESFQIAGARPSRSAIDGLYRAQQLAPQDEGLRFQAARQMLIEGEVAAAKRTLRPLAFSPHAPADNPAARLLAAVEKGATGPAAIAALDAEAAAAAMKAGGKAD